MITAKQANSIAGKEWIDEIGQYDDKSFWVSVNVPMYCEHNGGYYFQKSFSDFKKLKSFVRDVLHTS